MGAEAVDAALRLRSIYCIGWMRWKMVKGRH